MGMLVQRCLPSFTPMVWDTPLELYFEPRPEDRGCKGDMPAAVQDSTSIIWQFPLHTDHKEPTEGAAALPG
jgi:hypothetical protein